MSNESSAFKNLIHPGVVNIYTQILSTLTTQFDSKSFQKSAQQLDELELKARVRLISSALKNHLNHPYPKAIELLLKLSRTGKLTQFQLWPIAEYIRNYGLEYFDLSFQAMQEITELFTAEFAVRPFLIQDRERGFQILEQCAHHKNVHIRRWASEGSRPYLPWGEKIRQSVLDPSLNLKILEKLRFDPELYVRKSVANHLNDIAKDHPNLVIQTLKKWQKETPDNYKKEFQFILARALRTLIKNRNSQALQLMGVKSQKNDFVISDFKLSPQKVKFGNSLNFSFLIQHRKKSKKQKLIIDYAIHFQKANGQLAPKVFKLKTGMMESPGTWQIEKKHSFRPITTRVYYPGMHGIEIFVNGQSLGYKKFQLVR